MIISVITVCRNDRKGLENTIASMRSQDRDSFEWWVIDGNSSDGTVAWLRINHQFKGGWISEPDNGIYDAMNKGIGAAVGEYVLFMNSGDQFAEADVISRLVHAIGREEVLPDFVFGDSLDIEASGKSYYRKALPVSYIKVGMITRHQAMLYRRASVVHDRYPSNYKLSGDYALTASVLMKEGVKLLQVDFPICRFSLGGAHDKDRLKALREDFEIRSKILKENYLVCAILFCVHWLHHYVRKLAPNLDKRFIYRS
jgi:putative colanic acid biosynthesis glycosyltransferase